MGLISCGCVSAALFGTPLGCVACDSCGTAGVANGLLKFSCFTVACGTGFVPSVIGLIGPMGLIPCGRVSAALVGTLCVSAVKGLPSNRVRGGVIAIFMVVSLDRAEHLRDFFLFLFQYIQDVQKSGLVSHLRAVLLLRLQIRVKQRQTDVRRHVRLFRDGLQFADAFLLLHVVQVFDHRLEARQRG